MGEGSEEERDVDLGEVGGEAGREEGGGGGSVDGDVVLVGIHLGIHILGGRGEGGAWSSSSS